MGCGQARGKSEKMENILRIRHFGVQKELQHSRFVVFTEARGRSFLEPLCQRDVSRRLFSSPFGRSQESSRISVRPSPSGISTGLQSGLWSKLSGSAPVASLSWLNQFRSGSSSGIHSLMACQARRSVCHMRHIFCLLDGKCNEGASPTSHLNRLLNLSPLSRFSSWL